MPCDTGWQPQDDGSFIRTISPVNGAPPATVVATGTDGLSPVNLQRAVRVVVRHPATGQTMLTRFYSNLRLANRHVELLVETESLVHAWF